MTANRSFCASSIGLMAVLIVFLALTLMSYQDLVKRNKTLEGKLEVTPASIQENVLSNFAKVEIAHKEMMLKIVDAVQKRDAKDEIKTRLLEEILQTLIKQHKSVDPNNPIATDEITTGRK